MRKMILQCGGALALSLLALNVMAAVSADEAAKLGTTLTPVGAEKAGNADGSIPAWTGGLAKDAYPATNYFLSDPFASEKPLFDITAANADKYKDKLSEGQMAMLKRYPDYHIPVYTTHRTFSLPQAIYDAAKKSATTVSTINDGNGLANFGASRNYAFPIPKTPNEVLWNHITRYHGGNLQRTIVQVTPQQNGDFTPITFQEEEAVPQNMNLSPEDMEKNSNILLYFKQEVTAPARLAGNVLLVHETLDQVKEPRQAWIYNAGQRRVRLAPQVAYDGPGTASDGLRTSDNFDMFSGAPDRYDWKLIGKKEMYIPYNSYKLASPTLKYADIVKAGHINQDLTRYELHRVWEIVGTVKAGSRHIYATRHMYIDEDSWQIALVDHYDGRGQLWRVAEGHAEFYYNYQVAAYALEALYDLNAGRYIALGMNNEEKHGITVGQPEKMADYTPAALRNEGVK